MEDQTVFADRKMIEHCLINLNLNAIYAIADAPEKIIKTDIKNLYKRIILSMEDSGQEYKKKFRIKYFFIFLQQGSRVPELD